MANKKNLIKLLSTAGTGSFFVKKKNKKSVKTKTSGDEKLEFMKYDPKIRKRVIFKEAKLS